MELQKNLPEIFEEFAQKYENEDLIQFAFILKTAKKKGGNLIQVLEKTGIPL